MTKPEFLAAMVAKSGQTKAVCELVLDGFAELIQEEVHAKGDQISVSGLGIFKQKKSEARTGRNPSNGDPVAIPAKTKVVFSAASHLKK